MELTKMNRQTAKRVRAALIAVLVLALVINPLLTYAPLAIGAEGGEAAQATVRFDAGGASVEVDGHAPAGGELAVPAGEDLAMRVTAPEGFDVAAVTATAPDGTAAAAQERGGLYVVEGAAVTDGLSVRVDTVEAPAAVVAEDEGDGMVAEGPEAEDPAADPDAAVVGDDEVAEDPAAGPDAAAEGDEAAEDALASEEPAAGFELLEAAEASAPSASLKAPAPQDLFTISVAGTITAYRVNSNDPIKNMEIPATVRLNGVDVTVTGIASGVFSGCQLEKVTIPETVTSIGTNAFYNNPKLVSVTFAGTSQLKTIGSNAFKSCTSLASITLPDGLTSIGDGAFSYCSSLASIVIPDGVTKISTSLFSYCFKLASVTLSPVTTAIDSMAFTNCTSLTAISLPDGLTSIGSGAFSTTGLLEIAIPSTVQEIGANAFASLSSATNFKMYLTSHYPDAIAGKPWGAGTQYIYWKSYSNSCFDVRPDGGGGLVIVGLKPPEHDGDKGGCQHANWHTANGGTDVVIPSTAVDGEGVERAVTALLPSAFESNKNIRDVAFEAGCAITAIPEGAFYGSSLRSIVLPEGIRKIGKSAFASLGSMTSIVLPESLESIGESAFGGARFAEITIPAGVTSIGTKAFAPSAYLKKVTIQGGNAALTIAEDAFPTTNNLTDIYLLGHGYDGVAEEGDVAGNPWGAQYAKVHWADGAYNPQIIPYGGFDYNRITHQLVKHTGATGPGVDVVVPYEISYDGTDYYVEGIAAQLLDGKTFNSITVSEGITSLIRAGVSQSYFARGSTVNTVTLPSTLKSVPQWAFMNSTVSHINLPDGLTTIGYEAFRNCPNLTAEGIGNFLPGTVTSASGGAFRDTPLGIEGWEIPGTLKSIGASAFDNCGLTGTLTVPKGVTSIAADAFANNDITEIHIDHYRSTAPAAIRNGGDFGTGARVYYKGEKPQTGHEAVDNPALSDTPLVQVDLGTAVEKDDGPNGGSPVTSLRGIWVCKGDCSAATPAELEALFADPEGNGPVRVYTNSESSAISATVSMALPAGDYTAFVYTALMTKNEGSDPDYGKFVAYPFAVEKDGPALDPEAADVTYTAAKFQAMCAEKSDAELVAAVLGAASPSANDPWSGGDAQSFVASDAPAAALALRALTEADDTCRVGVDARYEGSYTYTGTQLLTPFGATFDYTATGSTDFAVTLVPGYTVAFDEGLHGGFPADAETRFPGLEDGDDMPAAPAVSADEGYTFSGWLDGASTFYEADGLPQSVDGSITFTAQYSLNSYRVDYDLNYQAAGLSIYYTNAAVGYGKTISAESGAQVPDNPARQGYDFGGWFKEASCKNAWDFGTDTVKKNTVLYAKWTPVVYSIGYAGLEGTRGAGGNPISYTIESNDITLANPTRDGYTFTGWTSDNENGMKVTIAHGSTGDRLYTANWQQDNTPTAVLKISASDFSMSLSDAQTHQSRNADDRLQELIARGSAQAWWSDTGANVVVYMVSVQPSEGDGKSVDAMAGTYYVTYYAKDGGQNVKTTVRCKVVDDTPAGSAIGGNNFSYNIAGGALSEARVRELARVTVYGGDGNATGELGRINAADLAALNKAIADGVTGPIQVRFTNEAGDEVTITVTLLSDAPAPTPIPGGGGTTVNPPAAPPAVPPAGPIEAAVLPVAEVMRDIAVTVVPNNAVPTSQINDEATPLAEGWCWVHYYIGAGMILMLAYAVGVIARRNRFTGDLKRLEDRVMRRGEAGDYQSARGLDSIRA